jgi:hypothetical protein
MAIEISIEEVIMQLSLPMLTVYEGPKLVDLELVKACRTYRDAVRACWMLRTRRSLTQALLAEETGCYSSHVCDYISESEAKRELPAKRIEAFERSCGNRLISQWLALQANLTILEQFIPAARWAA